MLPKLLDEGDVLAGKQECLGNYVEVLPYLAAQFLDLFDVFLEKVLPCYLLVPEEVVDLLEVKKVAEVNLRTGPGPQQVP